MKQMRISPQPLNLLLNLLSQLMKWMKLLLLPMTLDFMDMDLELLNQLPLLLALDL